MAIDRDGDGPPLRKDDDRASKPAEGLRASPFTEDVFDDEYYGRRRRSGGISFGVIAGVVFVAAMVAAAGWYIVGERSASTGSAEVGAGQIVKADPSPYKVKPDDPGGMQVDNQDKMIYDRVAKGAPPSRVENLLPAPEEPHAPPVQAAPAATGPATPNAPPAASPAPAASADDALAKLMAQLKTTAEPAQNTPPPAAAPAASATQLAPAAPATAPDKTAPAAPTTLGTAPVQVAAAPSTAPAAAAPTPPASAPASPLLLVPAADNTPPPATPSASPAAPQTAIAQPAPSVVTPTPAASIAAPSPSAGTGGILVQLASARSEDAAMGEWKRISGKNSDLLTGLTPSVVQAEVPDKGTYFRLRAGPLADKPAAETLCGALAARNVSCIVVRP